MSDEGTSKFDALLNTGIPLAPRSRAEALERLAASETEASTPQWAGKPAPNDELEELLRRMIVPRDASTLFLRELKEKRAVLARERVTAEVGGVSATMDGTGRPISMDISEDLSKGPHPRTVGEKVRSIDSLVEIREAELAEVERAAKADTVIEREIEGGLGKAVLDGRAGC